MEQATLTDSSTNVFIGRQPILDAAGKLFAYELLYRSSRENAFDGSDAAAATSRVISNAYLTIGMERLVGGRRVFINFDRTLLIGGLIESIPATSLVVELLEEITPDEEVLAACRSLKSKGYQLALDDFVCADGFEPLLELADIVKVDFLLTSAAEREDLTARLRHWNAKLLAEKVETQEEFATARDMGYSLFQGYYFSRPVVVSGRQIPAFKLNYLRILREVGNPELDFDRIEDVLKSDASLVHKLLRYVNSASFGWKREVESIRHALALLGSAEIRKWAALATLAGLGGDKPQQLVVNAVVRGRFCETLSSKAGLGARSSELFLLGLYSLLDALLDRPMEEIVSEVHLAADVQAVLVGQTENGAMADILASARAYERAEWPELGFASKRLRVDSNAVAEAYLEAAGWADAVFRGE